MDDIVTTTAPARLLPPEERRQWDEDGYLHIRNALSAGTVASLLDDLSALHERFTQGSGRAEYRTDVFDAGNDRDLSIANAITWCPGIAELLDHPGIFGRVLGLMGPYLQVLGSEIFYRYPFPSPLVDFHTDVGPALRTAAPAGDKAVQLKAQFLLTDVSQANQGNFTVAPGSHRRAFPGRIGFGQVEDAVQVLAAAGDVVLFPLSLGHGVAPNRSGTTRVSVILRYGQAFCRPVDYWTTPGQQVLEQLTPRRRRLFGDLGARSRPGDFYGAIPDQLELMYGDRWSKTAEARADLAMSAADQQAYEAS
jgi:Phytanoyl-CoA dioxygenase (PhyH)